MPPDLNPSGVTIIKAPASNTPATPSPRHRHPSSTDDASRGYQTQTTTTFPHRFADRWNHGAGLLTCEQNTPGNATWLPTPHAHGYPAAQGGILFSGGTLRMTPGYTGKALTVAHPQTGATLDIGLLDDDTLDEKTLWSFMGTAGHLEVAVIHDQSGNDNHITQFLPAHRYTLHPTQRLGRALALINDSDNFGPPVRKWMAIPDSLAIPPGGAISGAIVANTKCYNTATAYLTMTGSTGPFGIALAQGYVYGNRRVSLDAGLSRLNGFVAGFGSAAPDAGQSNLYIDGKFAMTSNGGGASYAGGYLGVTAAGRSSSPHEIAGLIIYGTLLHAPAEVQTLVCGLERHFGLLPQLKDNLILDGDSITYGYGCTYNRDYPHQMMPLLAHDFEINNTGYFGHTTAERLADIPKLLSYVHSAKNRNVFVEWSGTNDIDSARFTLAQMQSNMCRIIALAKAAGMKTIAATCLPRASFPKTPAKEEQRLAWNAWLRSGASGADSIADVAADATIGNNDNVTDRNYYLDGAHPTSLGYAFIAPIIAGAINRLVP